MLTVLNFRLQASLKRPTTSKVAATFGNLAAKNRESSFTSSGEKL
jgi:hypothetical protein